MAPEPSVGTHHCKHRERAQPALSGEVLAVKGHLHTITGSALL